MWEPATAIVMAKLPEPGRVKTRLTPALSPEQAAAVHGVFLLETLRRLRGKSCHVTLCYDPPDGQIGRWAGNGVMTLPQTSGDLGDRLAAAAEEHGGPVLFLGCDSPDLPEEHLQAAIALTSPRVRSKHDADVVIGPCDDGGFWCLGINNEDLDLDDLFTEVSWSSGEELEQVRSNAIAAGMTVTTAPPWRDVDRPPDLANLSRALSAPQAAQTAATLRTALAAAVRADLLDRLVREYLDE